MASNKRERSLDKSTRNTLTALEKALEMSRVPTLQADEFTTDQYMEGRLKDDPHITYDACRHALSRLVRNGVLKKRRIIVNGSHCNAYSAT